MRRQIKSLYVVTCFKTQKTRHNEKFNTFAFLQTSPRTGGHCLPRNIRGRFEKKPARSASEATTPTAPSQEQQTTIPDIDSASEFPALVSLS